MYRLIKGNVFGADPEEVIDVDGERLMFRCPCKARIVLTNPFDGFTGHVTETDENDIVHIQGSLFSEERGHPGRCHFNLFWGEIEFCDDATCPGVKQ